MIKIDKNPRKKYVIEFYRSIKAFICDMSFTEYGDSIRGHIVKSHLESILYGLERDFPYLNRKNAR